jgi:hypothetical protein
VAALFCAIPLDDRVASPDDDVGALFRLAPPDDHALEVLPFFRLHPSSTLISFILLVFFLSLDS